MSDLKLKGKVAIVGGASKNLGSQIAQALGKSGATVIVHYHNFASHQDAESTVATIRGMGSEAIAVQGDFTQIAHIENIFSVAKKEFGHVDIAINAAGKVMKKPLIEVLENEYDDMFAINTKAAFFFIREAAKQVSDGGKIINIATSLLAAFTGYYSVYAGAKAPLEHFTRAAAKELAPRGISVNSVAPGPLDTPFFYSAETPESVAYLKAASMNGQLGNVHDIAMIVKFLATDGWWVNGQTIFANGGFTTR